MQRPSRFVWNKGRPVAENSWNRREDTQGAEQWDFHTVAEGLSTVLTVGALILQLPTSDAADVRCYHCPMYVILSQVKPPWGCEANPSKGDLVATTRSSQRDRTPVPFYSQCVHWSNTARSLLVILPSDLHS